MCHHERATPDETRTDNEHTHRSLWRDSKVNCSNTKNTSQSLEVCLALRHRLTVMAATLGAIVVALCGHFNVRGVERVEAFRHLMLLFCAAMSTLWVRYLGAAWRGALARLHLNLTPPPFVRPISQGILPSLHAHILQVASPPSLTLLLRLPDLCPGTATDQVIVTTARCSDHGLNGTATLLLHRRHRPALQSDPWRRVFAYRHSRRVARGVERVGRVPTAQHSLPPSGCASGFVSCLCF